MQVLVFNSLLLALSHHSLSLVCDQWLHLCTVFSDPVIVGQIPSSAEQSRELHEDLLKFIAALQENPKVLALLEDSKKKKVDSFSGEPLRQFLDSCLEKQASAPCSCMGGLLTKHLHW